MKLGATLAALAATASILLGPAGAIAQAYPTKPITWVVLFTPGGITDSGARTAVVKYFGENGQVLLTDMTRAKFDPFIDKDMVKWKKLIETSGAKAF